MVISVSLVDFPSADPRPGGGGAPGAGERTETAAEPPPLPDVKPLDNSIPDVPDIPDVPQIRYPKPVPQERPVVRKEVPKTTPAPPKAKPAPVKRRNPVDMVEQIRRQRAQNRKHLNSTRKGTSSSSSRSTNAAAQRQKMLRELAAQMRNAGSGGGAGSGTGRGRASGAGTGGIYDPTLSELLRLIDRYWVDPQISSGASPESVLIAFEIDDEWMHKIESEIPELPIARYERYLNEYGMTAMEARQISDSFAKAELLDAAAKQVKPKAAANWILSDISKYLNDKGVDLPDTKLTADKLVDLVKLIEAGTISGAAGKKVLPAMFETDETVEAIVERMGLKQVSDEGAILAIVQEVIAKNEKAVADFKAGKNVTGFLVGQCMKASKGQGNPKVINKLIAQELAKL